MAQFDDDPFGDAPALTGRGAEAQPQQQPQQQRVAPSQPQQRQQQPADDDPFGNAPALTGRGAEAAPLTEQQRQQQQPAAQHAELPAHVTPQSSWSEIGSAAMQNAPVEWQNFKVAAKEAAQHPWDTANKAVEGVGNLADSAGYTAGEFARRHGWTGTADFLESKINAPGSGKPTIEPPTDTPEQRAKKADVVPGMVRDVGEFVAHPATAFGNAPLSTTANIASVVVPELRAGRLGQLADVVRGVKPAEAAAGAAATAAEREIGRGVMLTSPEYIAGLAAHGLTPGDITGAAREAMADVLGRKKVSPETIKEGIAAGATGEKAIPRHITTGEPIPDPAQTMVADSVATGHEAIRNRLGKIAGAGEGATIAPDHAALARGVEDAYVKSHNDANAAFERAYATPGTFSPDLSQNLDFHMGHGVQSKVPDFPTTVLEDGTKRPNWDAARKSPSLQHTSAAYDHVVDTLSRMPPGSVDLSTMSRLRKDLGTFQQAARGDDIHAMRQLIQGFDTGLVRDARTRGSNFSSGAINALTDARQTYRKHVENFREGPRPIAGAVNDLSASHTRDTKGRIAGRASESTAFGAGANIGKDLLHPTKGPAMRDYMESVGAGPAADRYIREHVLQHADRGGVSVFKHTPDQVSNMLKQPHISGAFTPEQLSQIKLANAARRLYDTKPSFTRKLSQGWKDNLLHMALQYGVPTALGIHGGLGEAAFGALFGPKFESFFAERAKKRAMSGAPVAAPPKSIGKSAGNLVQNAGHYAIGVPAQFAADQAARFGPIAGRVHMLGVPDQQQQQRASGGHVGPDLAAAYAKGWEWNGRGWEHRANRDAGGPASNSDSNLAVNFGRLPSPLGYRRGGAVTGHQHLVDRLFAAHERAKREEKALTSSILHQPDTAVAKALHVAQAAI